MERNQILFVSGTFPASLWDPFFPSLLGGIRDIGPTGTRGMLQREALGFATGRLLIFHFIHIIFPFSLAFIYFFFSQTSAGRGKK